MHGVAYVLIVYCIGAGTAEGDQRGALLRSEAAQNGDVVVSVNPFNIFLDASQCIKPDAAWCRERRVQSGSGSGTFLDCDGAQCSA